MFLKFVIIAFSLILFVFTCQQAMVGDPFKEEIHPFLILVLFLIISIVSLFKIKVGEGKK